CLLTAMCRRRKTLRLSADEGWTNMDKEEVATQLKTAGIHIVEEARNGNDNGWRLICDCGAIVNVYDSGKLVIQGKQQEPVRSALGISEAAPKFTPSYKPSVPASRKVFVVYGHDGPARTEVEAMLRRWDLEPMLLDQLPSGGQTIIEKLETYRKDAVFAVVIATPDDEGYERGHEDKKLFRARQNVVLEL